MHGRINPSLQEPRLSYVVQINVRERNYRDSAALCVRLAHNRKVGNFKRGSYLGVAQLGERVPWEHEAAGSRPATQTIRRDL